jgi:hypothetical protein
MASNSAREFFGIDLLIPDVSELQIPDVAYGRAPTGTAQTGTRPYAGQEGIMRTAGAQPRSAGSRDAQQIYNQGTNFAGQGAHSKEHLRPGWGGTSPRNTGTDSLPNYSGQQRQARAINVPGTDVKIEIPDVSEDERAKAECYNVTSGIWIDGECVCPDGKVMRNGHCAAVTPIEEGGCSEENKPKPEELGTYCSGTLDTGNRWVLSCVVNDEGENEWKCGQERDPDYEDESDSDDDDSGTGTGNGTDSSGSTSSSGGGSDNGGSSSNGGSDDGFQIPDDLKILRKQLSAFLENRFALPPAKFEGELEQQLPKEFGDALRSIDSAVASLERGAALPVGQMERLARFDASGDVRRSLQPFQQPMLEALQGVQDPTARRELSELARTGGAVDTTGTLNAIREAAMQQLALNQAQERERFGGMGLASGSDIAFSQSQGAAQGIAEMVRNQQLLQTQVDQARAQTRTAAAGTLGGLDISEIGALVNAMQAGAAIATAPATASLQSAAIRQAASQGLLGAEQLMMGARGQQANMQIGVGETQRQLDLQNVNAAYQDFLRRQQPSPYLGAALGYATGWPPQTPQKPVIQGGGGVPWGSLIGTIGMLAAAPMTGGSSLLGMGLGGLGLGGGSGRAPVGGWGY